MSGSLKPTQAQFDAIMDVVMEKVMKGDLDEAVKEFKALGVSDKSDSEIKESFKKLITIAAEGRKPTLN